VSEYIEGALRMSNRQTWRVHPAPGTYLDVAAVDETTLLAHESLTGANPNSFERWRRYDLSQLDAFAGPLTAPALDGGAAGGAP
jgi:hypothetical protein